MVNDIQDAETVPPVVLRAAVLPGIAGQVAVSAQVSYHDGSPHHVTFVGSVYGGPVVMVTGYGSHFIDRAVVERCGSELNIDWVMRFFGQQ